MKHSFLLASLFIITFSVHAQSSFFFPDKVNAPGRMESMQVKTTLALKPHVYIGDFPERQLGFNPSIDVAFSPVKHIVIAAAYRALIARASNDLAELGNLTDQSEYDGQRLEGCIGYNASFANKGIVEAAVGYSNGSLTRSKGRITANYDYWNYGLSEPQQHATDFTSRFHSFTVQAAVGTEDEYFSLRGGLKYTLQNFYNFSYKDKVMDTLLVSNPSSSDILNNNYGFIQPFVDIETGGKRVKFSAQAGLSQQMIDGFSVGGDLRGYMSFGVSVKLGAVN